MSNTIPLTEYANVAASELFELKFICRYLAGNIKYEESKLQDYSNKRADATPVTNQVFNCAANKFLGVFQLCRAVDIYNWYCRQSLKLAFSNSPQPIVNIIRKQSGGLSKIFSNAEKKGKDAGAVIQEFLQDRYKGDKIVRETIHCNLDVLQNPEIELLCTCRNILVHKQGHDEFGEIALEIQKLGTSRALIGAQLFPHGHMPISLDKENYLIIDDAIGNWAAELFYQQIYMMDQNFAHIYELPRKVWKRRKIGISKIGNNQ
jgi:hypothetical protein